MATLLHIDSSGRENTDSVTRLLSKYFVEKYKTQFPNDKVIYRDLAVQKPEFVNGQAITAAFTSKEELNKISALADEFVAADYYAFGVPMYNFSVPALFKAYIDQIVLPGKTFAIVDGKFNGLVRGHKAFVFTASGGDYSQPPMKNMNFLDPYLTTIFGFMGLTDVSFATATGHGAEEVAKAVEAAQSKIDLLIAELVESRKKEPALTP